MIDLHSHILPGLDDGARDMQEALKMAAMAAESGVSAMAVTPHCVHGDAQEVFEAWKLLQRQLRREEIPLKLYVGMEIFGTPETAELLRKEQLLTLNGSRYPLIEFGFYTDGEAETEILESVIQAGYRPVVAHPERYEYVQRDPELINLWHKMGCLLQINRGSLLGRFGSAARELALALVDRGFAALVASDAHSAQMRTPWMADARKLLREEFPAGASRCLLHDNPRKILNDEDMPVVEPGWF